MSKNIKITSNKHQEVNFEKEIMSKVSSGRISMKPKWYFIFGSFFSIVGLVALSIMSVFLVNIILFLLHKHGPMGQWRIEIMLESFPLWIPILAVLSIFMGIWLLNKYDFSYKKNFLIIIVGFIASIIVAGFIIDQIGLNDIWSRKGMMRKFYQRIENKESIFPNSSGKGIMQNGRGNGYKNSQ